MSNDATPFAGYDPNTIAGEEDLGSDFDLTGAAERAARTGSVCVEGAIKERRQRSSHHHGQGWECFLLDPRLELRLDTEMLLRGGCS